MAERPQVRQFQAPTQADIRPAASPVDTFVAQAKDYTQPSPLAQFLTAVTPAIEVEANQRKVDRLKREKEIADGVAKAKSNQLEQQATKFMGTIAYDYMVNEEAYKNAEIADVYQKIRESKEQYIGTLKQSNVDELLILEFDRMIEEGTETFMQNTLRPAKYVHTQDKLLENLKDGVLDIHNNYKLGLYKDEDGNLDPDAAMAEIARRYTAFYQDNSDYFTPSDNRVNDELDKLVIAMKDSEPFSIISQYMESTKHSKGQYGTKAKYAKSYDDLKQSRASVIKETAKANAKAAALNGVVLEAFQTNNIAAVRDKYYVDPSTNQQVKLTDDEIEQAVLSSAPYNALTSAGQKLRFLAGIGIVPTKLKRVVENGTKYLKAGMDVSSADDLVAIEAAHNQYQAMKNAGMDMSFLSDDQRKKLDALHYIAQDMAMVGEVTLEDQEAGFGFNEVFEETQIYTTKQDFNNAALIVQDMENFTGMPSDKEFREEIVKGLKGGWNEKWFQTTLNEVYNTHELTNDIVRGASALYSTGRYESYEHAAHVAAKIAEDDYKIVTSSDGVKYAFKHLNTDYTATMDVTETVNEYNETLAAHPKVSEAIFKKHGLKQGQYALGLYSDIANPNGVVIRVFDTSDDKPISLGTLGRTIDKRTLFTDEMQLNNLIGQSLDGATAQPVTTYTTDVKRNDEVLSKVDYYIRQALENQEVARQAEALAEGLGITAEDVETIGMPETGTPDETPEEEQPDETSLLDNLGDVMADAGSAIAREFGGVKTAAASTLYDEEGFSATPYDDMGKQSVGHGLQIESLEPDERALIKDINNVTEEESKAVVALKVDKLSNWWDDTVEGFSNLPESSQVSAISMAYQLGKENVAREWPKFMEAIKEAGQYAEGSAEQTAALAKAKFNMLYNVAEDGAVTATKWATQTADRAMRMAEGMVGDVKEAAGGIVQSVSEAVLPSAQASVLTPDEITPAKVGEKPKGEDVVAMASSPDLVTSALKYYGISENSKNGARAVEGFINNAVGGKAFEGSPEKVARNTAWCAAFLAQVLADSGVDVKGTIGKNDKYDAIRAKKYLNIGEGVDLANAKAGDIMVKVHTKADKEDYFKKTGEKLKSFGHVGIVIESKDGELYYIGGNTGDKVRIESYDMASKDLRIRRLSDVTSVDRDQLPSLREMKWGVAGTVIDKLDNAWTSMLEAFN